MKKLLTLFIAILFFSLSGFGQTSKDNYSGNWTDGNSWIGGTAPANIIGNQNITINPSSYIKVGTDVDTNPGHLSFNGASDYFFEVGGTVVVYGNVTFDNMANELHIGTGGKLIIFGDLNMANKATIASDGILIVKGTFTKAGAEKHGEFSGDGRVYAGSYGGSADEALDGMDFKIDPDLFNDFPEIADFVDSGGNIGILPITLLHFTAEVSKENHVELSWATASEENFDYFSIERSVNGENFEAIGQVKGSGNSSITRDYTFTDKFPAEGVSFYRLRSVDFDGYTEYFKIVSVSVNNIAQQVEIYPNPFSGHELSILSNLRSDSLNQVKILNSAGREVFASNLHLGSNHVNFDEKLPKGLYYIVVGEGSIIHRAKLIVQ